MKQFGLALFMFLFLNAAYGQKDTLIRRLDSLSQRSDSAGGQVNNTHPTAYNEATEIGFSTFFVLQGSTLKQAFTKPFHMSKKNWSTFGKFALITGALAFADEPVQRFALDLRNHNKGVRNIGKVVTNFGGLYEAYTLGAFGAYGFLFKKEKMQTTTLLAVQSYVTGVVVETVLKTLSGRQRPSAFNPNQVEAEPTFLGPFKKISDAQGNNLNSAFPSGHTTVAFAAATVYAMEYRDKPWVPVLCYASASLIGLSRITENKHWATDVFVGAALGYVTGRLVVNNYHRYARLKAPRGLKNSVSLSMGVQNGVVTPGLHYRF